MKKEICTEVYINISYSFVAQWPENLCVGLCMSMCTYACIYSYSISVWQHIGMHTRGLACLGGVIDNKAAGIGRRRKWGTLPGN